MNGSILVVDDDDAYRYLVQIAFKEIAPELRVNCLKDGDELLEYLERVKPDFPDFVMMDGKMRKMDGIAALKQVKARPHLRDVPIIIFSGSLRRDDIHEAHDAGASEYLHKPEAFEELLVVLRKTVYFWIKTVA